MKLSIFKSLFFLFEVDISLLSILLAFLLLLQDNKQVYSKLSAILIRTRYINRDTVPSTKSICLQVYLAFDWRLVMVKKSFCLHFLHSGQEIG